MCLSFKFVSTLNLNSLDNDKSIIKPFFLLSASENPCPSNILTGQKFFLETSLILGPFLESIKKAIKLSEIERANIVQRQSITFTTLYFILRVQERIDDIRKEILSKSTNCILWFTLTRKCRFGRCTSRPFWPQRPRRVSCWPPPWWIPCYPRFFNAKREFYWGECWAPTHCDLKADFVPSDAQSRNGHPGVHCVVNRSAAPQFRPAYVY